MSSIFDDLFELSDPVANSPFRGSLDWSVEDATAAFSRGERSPSVPAEVSWGMGSGVPSDVIWTLLGLPVVVSSTVGDVLERGAFTGWDTYPVRVRGKSGRHVPGFHGLAITGRCDPPDLSRSQLVLRQYPGGRFPVLRGLFFNEASWDGSDLFMERPDPRGNRPVTLYVTGPVMRALGRRRIANIRCEKLSEREVDPMTFEIGSRYRLPSDYDDRVAALYK